MNIDLRQYIDDGGHVNVDTDINGNTVKITIKAKTKENKNKTFLSKGDKRVQLIMDKKMFDQIRDCFNNADKM